MIKKLSILFVLLAACLYMAAAEANAYYRVTASTLNGRSNPTKMASKVKHYAKNEVIYITEISSDGKWGYVYQDKTWVHLSYLRQIKQAVQEEIVRPNGSYPLRVAMWVLLGLLIVGSGAMYFADKPLRSVGALYGTILLCALVIAVLSYAQFIMCWGLKIVGWIDHYILFGWLVDSLANGILAIIPFALDIPTYGLYGLIVGVLPMAAFYFIGELFDDYPFSSWVIYFFQLTMLLLILILDNDSLYMTFNQPLQLDGVGPLSSLADACNWGEYANDVFIWAFYLGTITLLAPRALVNKIFGK